VTTIDGEASIPSAFTTLRKSQPLGARKTLVETLRTVLFLVQSDPVASSGNLANVVAVPTVMRTTTITTASSMSDGSVRLVTNRDTRS